MFLYNRDINWPEQAPGRPLHVWNHIRHVESVPFSPDMRRGMKIWKKPSKFLPVKTSFHANERWPEMLPHRRIPPVTDGELCCLESVYLLSLCVILFPNLEKKNPTERTGTASDERLALCYWCCKGEKFSENAPHPSNMAPRGKLLVKGRWRDKGCVWRQIK